MTKVIRSGPKGIYLLLFGFIGGIISFSLISLVTFLFHDFLNERIFRSIIGLVAGIGGFMGLWLTLSVSSYNKNELFFKGKTRFDKYLPSWPVFCLLGSIFFAGFATLFLYDNFGISLPFGAAIGGVFGTWMGGEAYINGGLIKFVSGFFGAGIGLIIGVLNNYSINSSIGGLIGLISGYTIGVIIGLILEDKFGIIKRR
jgi:hypothetical protein